MLGIVVNIALLTIWLLIFHIIKRNVAVVLLGVAIGIVGVFLLSGLIQLYWLRITGIPLTEHQNKAFIAPIVEESSKFLFILLVAWKSRRVSSEITIFGVSVGLGFAFIENFGFIANALNLLLRGFSSWILHMATTVFLSYGIRSRLVLRRSTIWTVFGLLAAMLIHGVFNYAILSLGLG